MHSLSRVHVGIAFLVCAVTGVPRVNAAASGTVVAWGDNTLGQIVVPAALSGVTAIAAHGSFTLALKNDGTVVAWGDNAFGQSTVPTGLSGVTAIAAGESHAVVLKRDGTVVAWGDNSSGQTSVPAGLSGVTAIAAGGIGPNPGVAGGFTVALKSDGTVVAWGHNLQGQTDVPTGLSGVVAISAGVHVLALRRDGTVVGWGRNDFGQRDVPAGLSGVTAIAANGGLSLALKSDGTVVAWGVNNFGQTDVPIGLSGVAAISAGAQFSMALLRDGTVVAWGQSREGQRAIPAGLSGVTTITAGSTFAVALIGTGATAPTFIVQPLPMTVAAGSTVALSSAATGATSFQWRKDGTNIVGATSSTLVLQNTSATQAGAYTVVATNTAGSTTSAAATLTVSTSTSDPGRLINLSILTPLAANETMTMGTVLGGAGTSGTKPLLARAAGPSLAQLGVTGFLPDPTMSLVNTGVSPGVTVATNNDWAGATSLANAFASVGAFAYASATSKDAAIFQPSLASGSYTVQVSDAGTGSGTVIAELYDASGPVFTLATPRLVNVSVLKQISTGGSLTAGFVVGGTTAKTVLIRAVGPTLGGPPFNLGGVMADPQLNLFNSSQAPIASNDDWGGEVQVASVASRVGAFALSVATSKDAVLLITLAPGNYTAQVGPASATAGGTVIVEVYEVP